MNTITFETAVAADHQLHYLLPASLPVGCPVKVTVEPIPQLVDFADFLAHREEKGDFGSEQQDVTHDLKPLPEFPGKVPAGWKDAVYAEH